MIFTKFFIKAKFFTLGFFERHQVFGRYLTDPDAIKAYNNGCKLSNWF